MRILLVTDWNRGQGGAEAYIAALRAELEREGDEVRLLTSSAGTAGDGRADYVALGTENRAAQAALQIANPFAIATVRRAVREFRPDITVVNMFAHHLSPAALLPLQGIPSVLLVTDYKCICPVGSKLLPNGSRCDDLPGAVCWRQGCTGLLHWLRDLPPLCPAAFAAGPLPENHRLQLMGADGTWPSWHLGRSATLLLPAGISRLPTAPSATPELLFAGRLDREKGCDVLLAAFARAVQGLPEARLRIAGRGPEREPLAAQAARLGISDRVEFLGWLDALRLEQELSRTWSLVVPSLWAEPLGLVAVEAVLRAVPVIASAEGGLAEVVEPGVSGLLVPNGNSEALAESLGRLLRGEVFPDHVLADSVVARTRQRFDPVAHVRSLRDYLRVAIGKLPP